MVALPFMLGWNQGMQVIFLALLNMFSTIYICNCKPYVSVRINRSNLRSECFLLMATDLMFLFSDWISSNYLAQYSYAWWFILLVIVFFIFNLLFLIAPPYLRRLFLHVYMLFKKTKRAIKAIQ